jgi:hypothetical protein
MPDETRRTDDSEAREREKREAQERETEDHAITDREDRGDAAEEAVREGVPGIAASCSD